jgi:type IV secretion system protein VirD4
MWAAAMANVWATDGGIYFGVGSKATEGPPPATGGGAPLFYVGDRHIVTFGPNGSGKSRRTLWPNVHNLVGWSMLVVDPKGELARDTVRHRLAKENDVVILNPFNVGELGSNGFNPIAALKPDSDDFPDDAMGLAEAIIKVEGMEPHWSQSAQDLVCALIMYSRLTAGIEDGLDRGTLGFVRHCLGKSNKDFRDMINEAKDAGIDAECPELVVKAARYMDVSTDNKELNSVISTALTQTRWLDSRPIKEDLRGPAHDFSKLKEKPAIIYLILPARRLGTHSSWLRLVITSVLQSLMKDTDEPKCPTLLMLDEFAQLGHLPVIEQTLAMMRGYGVKLWSVFQDLSQAQAIYGKRWETFMSNAGVLHAYAPQDVVTAEYLSKRTGQTTKEILTWSQESKPGEQTASGNIGMTQTPLPLMLPQDLRNMDMGYFVLFSHKTKGTIRGYAYDPGDLMRKAAGATA